MSKNLAKEVASNLLKIKAVFLKPNDPFTWASGIKSPIYCDNRLTLSYPETRKVVEDGLAEVIKEHFPTCEVVMGTSTAGIPHAAYVSEILNLPMGYVRGGAKDHGRGNQIEGVVPVGKDVVVIEDLISTAGSSIEVVEVLREAGCNVLGIASIFTYNLQKGIDTIKISCLPKDLPVRIIADISELKIGEKMAVKQIALPEGVKVVSNPDAVIATVKAPRR